MKPPFTVRPEDFRHSWANAYHMAMMQGAEMHLRADIILERSELSIRETQKVVQHTVKLLETTVEAISKKLESQGNLQEQKLRAAAHALLTEHSKLREAELIQLARHAQQTATLQSERNAFEAAKRLFYRKPLWRRVFEAAWMPPAARSTSPKSSQIK